ncbi:MAG: hypothetical protein C4589_09750 [Peptococcaceae bacterium]|jgi:hypothetical protein|nr:MAG: hypothetical protein C4589_09750 [Peptococcaceae bacterium]
MPRKELPEFKGDRIPEFASEEEEREFWDSYSFADAMERGVLEPLDEPVELDPALEAKIRKQAETEQVTLRLSVSQIEAAKEISKKKDIPYQTLIRSWVAEAIRREQQI